MIDLIRHTKPNIEKGICYGQTDIELADSFEQEQLSTLKLLESHYDIVFSSPLIRCKQLAECIPSNEFILDERLKEVDFGDWELKPWNNIPNNDIQPWFDDFVNIAPPNGESLVAMQTRVFNFIKYVNHSNYKDKRIAVVTHSGVIRLIVANVLSMPLSDIFALEIGFGEVTTLDLLHFSSTL